jgi:hypothetical protein
MYFISLTYLLVKVVDRTTLSSVRVILARFVMNRHSSVSAQIAPKQSKQIKVCQNHSSCHGTQILLSSTTGLGLFCQISLHPLGHSKVCVECISSNYAAQSESSIDGRRILRTEYNLRKREKSQAAMENRLPQYVNDCISAIAIRKSVSAQGFEL